MSRGAVILARDSGDISYTGMAQWSAERIQRHLGIPTTIIKDQSEANGAREMGSGQMTWYNLDRFRAWELSPYDETLLLDADYVVSSDRLASLFGSYEDMLAMRYAYDVTARRDYTDLNWFGRHRMPSAWATVIYFRRTRVTEMIFHMIQMIQQHWPHYKDIYGITERRFRNDYALAMALNVVHGHLGHWPAIPWHMANADLDCDIQQIDEDDFEIRFHDSRERPRRVMVREQDIHVMNKSALGAVIANFS